MRSRPLAQLSREFHSNLFKSLPHQEYVCTSPARAELCCRSTVMCRAFDKPAVRVASECAGLPALRF